MKKIISLAFAAGLVLSASAPSYAGFSVNGYFMGTGEFLSNSAFADEDVKSNFKLYERLQLTLQGTSDHVTANLTVRVPNGGKLTMVGGQPAGKSDSEVAYSRGQALTPQLRIASLTFAIPNTPVSVIFGQHPIAFPGHQNALFDASAPGIQVSANLGNLTPKFAYWLEDTNGGRDQHTVYAQLPIAINDTMKVTPYGGFTDKLGGGVSFAGLLADANLDTLSVGASALYKTQDSEKSLSNLLIEAHAAMDLGFLTPGIFAWYGMDGADGSAATPFQSSWSTFGSWGSWNNANDVYDSNGLQTNLKGGAYEPFNSFGVIANVSNINFTDSLTFGAHVMYSQRTDDEDEKYDSRSNIAFGGELVAKLYDELSFTVDAVFLKPLTTTSGNNTGLGSSIAGTLYYTF